MSTDKIPDEFLEKAEKQFSEDAIRDCTPGSTWTGYWKGYQAACRHLSQQPGLRDLLIGITSVYTGLCYRLPEKDKNAFLQLPSYLNTMEFLHSEVIPSTGTSVPEEQTIRGAIKVMQREIAAAGEEAALYRRLLIMAKEGYSDHFTNYFNDEIDAALQQPQPSKPTQQ